MKITQPITIKKLKEIYDEYFDELFGFVYVRNGFRREDAEETIHDLFVRFWENRERFDPDKGSLRTWLYAILKNLLYDSYRKSRRSPKHTSLEDLDLSLIEDHDEMIDLTSALNQLSVDDKELLTLFYINEWSIEEISELLNKEKGAVKVSLHRARKRLREIYEKAH